MRLQRLLFVLLAFYFVLLGGSTYYYQVFAFRVLHHGVASAILIVWLASRLRRGIPKTPINGLIYALIGVWLISAIASVDVRAALENLWLPLTHVILFWIIADRLQRGREKLVFETTFLLLAVVVLMGFLQIASWYFGLGIFPRTAIGWIDVIGEGAWLPIVSPQVSAPVGVSTWLAALVAPAIVISAAWGMTAFQRSFRPVLLGLAVGLTILLIATGSRGGLVALAGAIAVYIALMIVDRARARLSPRILWSAGGAIAVIALAGALVLLSGQQASRWTGDILRLNLWRGAVTMIADRPLTGVGVGLFGRVYREVRDPVYVDDRLGTAHNAYLNGVAENGLLGAIIGVLLIVAIVRVWWQRRQMLTGDARIRLDACAAALAGFAAQSLFDSFVITTIVALTLVLIAYCVVTPGSRLEAPTNPHGRLPAFLLLLIVSGAAIAFIPIDRAHADHNASLIAATPEDALRLARSAQALDPHLRLYSLQVAYLESAIAEDAGDRAAAIAAYERAVTLEPTWDTGWINLAALYEADGQIDSALGALDQAHAINHANTALLHWARIADAHDAADDATIRARYRAGMRADILPRSDWWLGSARRTEVIRGLVDDPTSGAELRYRIVESLFPDQLTMLIPDAPQTSGDFWARGQHHLRSGDPTSAAPVFREAIARRDNRQVGDYHAALGRALGSTDRAEAARFLAIADLLYTFNEYPNAARATLTDDPARQRALRIAALPPRTIDQNFEAVLFQGRVATFDVVPSMRAPGPGRLVMTPWYDLAQEAVASGRQAEAIAIYRAILDYAPGETDARDALNTLGAAE